MFANFDEEAKKGMQCITEWINSQAIVRGIKLDDIEWRKDSRGDKHIVESRIMFHGNMADQWFTREQLIHCQQGELRENKAFFDVTVKIESMFLHLGL
jgi:hypothetical protein